MIKQVQLFCEKFDALSQRERILVTIGGLFIIITVWFLLILQPLYEHTQVVQLRIEGLQQNTQRFQQQARQILANVAQYNTSNLHNRQNVLLAQNQELEMIFKNASSHLVTSQQVIELLKDLLNEQSDLTFRSFITFPMQAIEEKNTPPAQRLHRQPMQIIIQGNYFSILEYLKKIESLNWHIITDELQYRVDQHPKGTAVIHLHVFTLPLNKNAKTTDLISSALSQTKENDKEGGE